MTDQEIITDVSRKFRRIKVTGKNYIYPVNKSVGFKGLSQIVGKETAIRVCKNALKSEEHIPVAKLGRGLKIKFES